MEGDHFLQIHMFDISIPGDITFYESSTFSAGVETTIVDTGLIEILVAAIVSLRCADENCLKN